MSDKDIEEEEERREDEEYEKSPEFLEAEKARKAEEGKKVLDDFAEFVEKEESEKLDEVRQKKLEVLGKIEKSLEESEKEDDALRARRVEVFEAELKRSIFWDAILSNPSWEPLLKDIIRFVNAQTRGKIPKLVITFENDGKTMSISKEFFDKDGQRIVHELTDNILGENEE